MFRLVLFTFSSQPSLVFRQKTQQHFHLLNSCATFHQITIHRRRIRLPNVWLGLGEPQCQCQTQEVFFLDVAQGRGAWGVDFW